MTEQARPRGTDHARIVPLIVTKSIVGSGGEGDPCREVTQYWELDGTLVATLDEYLQSKNAK